MIKQTVLVVSVSALLSACGSASFGTDIEKKTAEVVKESFVERGIAKLDRLNQDEAMAICSAADMSGKPLDASVAKSGPGRPKLGVVAREVTLLPRHWAWLSSQPGGASVALRKLVEQARKDSQSQDQRRLSQEATYRFMSVMAGCLEGFEEAARALFAADRLRFEALTASWPQDIQNHLQHLAQAAWLHSDVPHSPELPHA